MAKAAVETCGGACRGTRRTVRLARERVLRNIQLVSNSEDFKLKRLMKPGSHSLIMHRSHSDSKGPDPVP